MELDRIDGDSQRGIVRRTLSVVAGLAGVAAIVGLGWAIVDPRGGGAMLAFCGFVTYLVARAVKWSV